MKCVTGGSYHFPGPPVSRYHEFKPRARKEQEEQKEVEALREYGVDITSTHNIGYEWIPEWAQQARKAAPEPWDQSILEQLGECKPIQSSSAETWNNEEFLLEIEDGIAYCTLNRPAANNAINAGILDGLHDAALVLRERTDVRVVVLTGNGRLFCAGGDPKSLQQAQENAGANFKSQLGEREGVQDRTQEEMQESPDNPAGNEITGYYDTYRQVYRDEEATKGIGRDLLLWATLPQFTICCLNGSAMGSGVGLVCACDMVVALRTAHITMSEVKLGLIPAPIAPFVIRTVGLNNAKRLFITCENAGIHTAMQMGIVQRAVAEVGEFPAVIKEIVTKIQALAPEAVAATKRALLNCLDKPTSSGLIEYVVSEYASVRKGAECELGIKALASKKKPEWMQKPIAVKE